MFTACKVDHGAQIWWMTRNAFGFNAFCFSGRREHPKDSPQTGLMTKQLYQNDEEWKVWENKKKEHDSYHLVFQIVLSWLRASVVEPEHLLLISLLVEATG